MQVVTEVWGQWHPSQDRRVVRRVAAVSTGVFPGKSLHGASLLCLEIEYTHACIIRSISNLKGDNVV